jgi:hypothetical protein
LLTLKQATRNVAVTDLLIPAPGLPPARPIILQTDQSLESFSDLRRVIWVLLTFGGFLMVVALMI